MEFAFGIDDQMSSPLDRLEKALGGTVKGMAAAEKESKRLDKAMAFDAIAKEKDPLKQRSMGLKLYQDELVKSKEKTAAFVGVSTDTLEKFGSVKGVFLGVTAAVAGLAVGIGALAVKLTEASLKQGAFRAASIRSLDATLGNTAAAKDAYAWLFKLSQGTQQTGAELIGTFQDLITSGLNEHNAKDIIASSADLAATRGKAASESFLEIFKKTAESAKDPNTRGGIFDEDSLKKLDGLGKGTKDQFLKTIAAQHKVTERQALMLIQNGRVKAQEGLNALMDINENNAGGGKGVGFKAKDVATGDAATQIKNIEQNFARLFEMGDGSPLAKALGKIASMIDPSSESGVRLQKVMTGLFEDVGKFVDRLMADPAKISGAFNKVVSTVEMAGAAVKTAVDLVGIAFELAGLPVKILGAEIFAVSDAWDNMGAGVDRALKKLEAVFGFGDKMTAAGRDIAGALLDGIIDGITGNFGKVAKAVVGLGDGVIAGVKSTLGIHSPSKVMMRLGGYVGEGFTMGLEKTPKPSLDAVMPAMPTIGLPQPAAAASGASGGGRAGVSVGDIHVTVMTKDGKGDAHSVGLAAADAIRAEWLRITEGMATEQGSY